MSATSPRRFPVSRAAKAVDEVPDEALLVAFANGDSVAGRDLLARLAPMLFGYATRVLGDRSEAEDVVQDTLLAFLDAWRRGRYDRDRGRLGSFLFAIAVQQVRTHHRKAQRVRRQFLPEAEAWTPQGGLLGGAQTKRAAPCGTALSVDLAQRDRSVSEKLT